VNIPVELGDRSYDIVVEAGARRALAGLIARLLPDAQSCCIITSESLLTERWFDIDSGINQYTITVPDGEESKTVHVLGEVLEQLAEAKLSRRDLIVSVGGGAVTDLAGFAAATYLRGIAIIHIPTTLLAQVDAAIGGKTGINLSAGKNLAGAFHQPLAVLCDTEVTATLPPDEIRSGLGEVAKCWLLEEKGREEIVSASSQDFIELSVLLKARIVSGDEREGGARALLNYGHTLAHAIEKLALAANTPIRHGEAVSIGLRFAVRLAHALGRVDESAVSETDAVVAGFDLDYAIPKHFRTEDLVQAMSHDKKAHHDLTFVLPGRDGFQVVSGIDRDVVTRVLEEFRNHE
jgi:5-deoxy-5-amino-3-dehydroquinate synthase